MDEWPSSRSPYGTSRYRTRSETLGRIERGGDAERGDTGGSFAGRVRMQRPRRQPASGHAATATAPFLECWWLARPPPARHDERPVAAGETRRLIMETRTPAAPHCRPVTADGFAVGLRGDGGPAHDTGVLDGSGRITHELTRGRRRGYLTSIIVASMAHGSRRFMAAPSRCAFFLFYSLTAGRAGKTREVIGPRRLKWRSLRVSDGATRVPTVSRVLFRA